MKKRAPHLFYGIAIAAFTALMNAAVNGKAGDASIARQLPAATELGRALGKAPTAVRVIEPHLTRHGKSTTIDYLGWPAEAVFDHLLGESWRKQNADIEFRALDGYISRIDIAKFSRHRAYLVVDIQGGKPFTVDNLAQNERAVPLGPYYLVWDNIASAELIEDGASDWPYQISTIGISTARQTALLPGDMRARFTAHAALIQKHCLTCHRANGYGGDKWPIDLTLAIKTIDFASFRSWILDPSARKADTAMPALLPLAPAAKRYETADAIIEYLQKLSTVVQQ